MEGSVAPPELVFDRPQGAHLEDSWWSRYAGTLDKYSATSRKMLEADAAYIVDRGIFGDGEPGANTWPNRVRKGLVMGSVQSGKTASMLGVIAKALDRGVDVVVVLAGTRLSLWQQTLERVRSQLDVPRIGETTEQSRRLLLPKAPPRETIPLLSRYQLTGPKVARNLEKRQPIIIVALKNTSHLHALRQSLGRVLFPEVETAGRAVHMLVVDDEADDASVLDARVESSQDPIFGELKQIPRAIVDLWSPPEHVVPDSLYATYVGYTATPQANFLQEEHNPLSPRDFVVTLRTPLDVGDVDTRSPTYAEPRGLTEYYTGGEVYYRRGKSAGLCVPTTGTNDDLGESIRGFLVAGAIRVLRSGSRMGPTTARSASFQSALEAELSSPAPHSMLIHPSAAKSDHFEVAEEVLKWAGAADSQAARAILAQGGALQNDLIDDLAANEAKWRKWIEVYEVSSNAIHQEFNTPAAHLIPAWSQVRQTLESEVIPGTRVVVINSDPAADDNPEFTPRLGADGAWHAGRDMCTIFVSGNVMARGLTIEGLTTTLFLRSASSPAADTQMQMQRWFGYRGGYIELCRVFASPVQLNFFEAYHDVDEALRSVIAEAMNAHGSPPTPHVLAGRGFLATGKIANLSNKALHPGRKPFIRFVNSGAKADPNAELVASLFSMNASSSVRAGGIIRGRILDNPLDLLQAAELLDRLAYADYTPGTENQIAELWSQVEDRVVAVQPLPDGQRLYQAPAPPASAQPSPVSKDCPYSIPAYLRLWEAATTRHIRGLFVNDSKGDRWSMVDLEAKRSQRPRFWIGIRFGGLRSPAAGAPFAELPFVVPTTNKHVENGAVQTTWGSNDPNAGPSGYRGDEYFDYYHRGEHLPPITAGEGTWRPSGSDGLILFYVNQQVGVTHPAVVCGVCVPAGGPDQFAAYVMPSSS